MYITLDIPLNGGLASQIQQYASLYAIAKENNKIIVFKESLVNRNVGFLFSKILNIKIELKPDSFFDNFVRFDLDSSVIVDANVFNLNPNNNYYIYGLFNLFHYWHSKYNLDVFNWEWNTEIYNIALERYSKIENSEYQTVSLHIRAGDYLLPQHHHFHQLGHDYYSEAISKFDDGNNYKFIVFSNDTNYAKSLFEESTNDLVIFVNGDSEQGNTIPTLQSFEDLILMSLCDHNIISNSSFSWWAAFMNKNKNKKVICPSNYLKDYSAFTYINKNYYPSDWISIDNK